MANGNGNGFKRNIAYMVMWAAMAYAGFATLCLAIMMYIMGDKDMSRVAIIWSFMSNMISTVLGVLLSKLSTIVDHQFGSSTGAELPPLPLSSIMPGPIIPAEKPKPMVQEPIGKNAVG